MTKHKRINKRHHCKRSPLIGCVVKPAMKRAIDRAARRKGMNVSEWLRFIIAKHIA